MKKNSIGANFTGTGLKRSKKYYSDIDAGKFYFKPDHSEFYPGSTLPKTKGNKSSKVNTFRNEDIDVIEIPGAASVVTHMSKEIVNSFKNTTQYNEDIGYITPVEDDYQNDDQYIPARQKRKIHTLIHPVEIHENPTLDPKRKKYEKNALARNAKTNRDRRPWQEFQQAGGYNIIDQTVEEYNIMEDARTESGETKSQLEEILENKPHIIWSRKDEKNLNREKHKRAA